MQVSQNCSWYSNVLSGQAEIRPLGLLPVLKRIHRRAERMKIRASGVYAECTWVTLISSMSRSWVT